MTHYLSPALADDSLVWARVLEGDAGRVGVERGVVGVEGVRERGVVEADVLVPYHLGQQVVVRIRVERGDCGGGTRRANTMAPGFVLQHV